MATTIQVVAATAPNAAMLFLLMLLLIMSMNMILHPLPHSLLHSEITFCRIT